MARKSVIKVEFEAQDKRLEKLSKIDRIIELRKIESDAKKERYDLESELGI